MKTCADAMIDRQEAIELLSSEGAAFYGFLARAGTAREEHKGRGVTLCGILNAKSGRCGEDCAFCAQSSFHDTDAPTFPLVSAGDMVARAREVQAMGAREYSIVTSGNRIHSEKEIAEICKALGRLSEPGRKRMLRCASLGNLPASTLARLKEAGLTNYHHNLETARSFFPKVCTTHDYEDDVDTVRRAKEIGLDVCCGGIFGLGESRAQRIELAETLRDLDVDSIPLNFLNPIAGTPLEGKRELTPVDCLKIIALFRLMMPAKNIYVCGGREVNLGELQSWIFLAGANGMMVGNYLTTSGRDHELDLQMIADQGLEVLPCGEVALR